MADGNQSSCRKREIGDGEQVLIDRPGCLVVAADDMTLVGVVLFGPTIESTRDSRPEHAVRGHHQAPAVPVTAMDAVFLPVLRRRSTATASLLSA